MEPSLPVIGAGSKPALNKPALNHETKQTRAGLEPAPTVHGLSEIIRQFKTFSAKRINQSNNTPGIPVWQRNYYDHVIRDEKSLNEIREYIVNNPANWEDDVEYVENM